MERLLFSFLPHSFLYFWGVLFILHYLPFLFSFPEQHLEVGAVLGKEPHCGLFQARLYFK